MQLNKRPVVRLAYKNPNRLEIANGHSGFAESRSSGFNSGLFKSKHERSRRDDRFSRS
jgi:hypothetical protein